MRLWLALTLTACGSAPAPTQEQCVSCHTTAADAWSTSAHGNANRSALFSALLPRVEARWGAQERARCESCHAPVTCVTCHLAVGNNGEANRALVIDDDAAVATSSMPDAAAPHRTVTRSFFRSASLCGTCHEVRTPHLVEETLTEYRASDRAGEDSCATCHFDGHRFEGASPALLARALELAVTSSEVRLTNVGAAHAVPTGQLGLREVWVDVTVIDDSGAVHEFSRALDLTADLGGADVFTEADTLVPHGLAANETRVFPISGSAARVSARLYFRSVRATTARALGLPTAAELVLERSASN